MSQRFKYYSLVACATALLFVTAVAPLSIPNASALPAGQRAPTPCPLDHVCFLDEISIDGDAPQAVAINAAGSAAYVASGPSGVWAVDTCDPWNLSAPKKAGAALQNARDVFVHKPAQDAVLYVLDDVSRGQSGMGSIVDSVAFKLTNPLTPELWDGRSTARIGYQGEAYDTAASGTKLVMALGAGGMCVVDADSPESRAQCKQMDTSASAPRSVEYYSSQPTGEHLFVSAGNRLCLVDVAGQQGPSISRCAAALSSPLEDVAVVGTIAYAAAGPIGLAIFDLSGSGASIDPPTIVSLRPGAHARTVAAAGSRLFIGAGLARDEAARAVTSGGLFVFDIHTPGAPTLVPDSFLQALPMFMDVRDIVLRDGVAYVVDANAGLVTLAFDTLAASCGTPSATPTLTNSNGTPHVTITPTFTPTPTPPPPPCLDRLVRQGNGIFGCLVENLQSPPSGLRSGDEQVLVHQGNALLSVARARVDDTGWFDVTGVPRAGPGVKTVLTWNAAVPRAGRLLRWQYEIDAYDGRAKPAGIINIAAPELVGPNAEDAVPVPQLLVWQPRTLFPGRSERGWVVIMPAFGDDVLYSAVEDSPGRLVLQQRPSDMVETEIYRWCVDIEDRTGGRSNGFGTLHRDDCRRLGLLDNEPPPGPPTPRPPTATAAPNPTLEVDPTSTVAPTFTPPPGPTPPRGGIVGLVKTPGQLADDQSLCLVRGSAGACQATTRTERGGSFAFGGVPGLAEGESYRVLWLNTDNDEALLAQWETSPFNYVANTTHNVGIIDLGNVDLTAPLNRPPSPVPLTLEWTRRGDVPWPPGVEQYQLQLRDGGSGSWPPTVGWVPVAPWSEGNSAQIASETGLSLGVEYQWTVRVRALGMGTGWSSQRGVFSLSEPPTPDPRTPPTPTTASPTPTPGRLTATITATRTSAPPSSSPGGPIATPSATPTTAIPPRSKQSEFVLPDVIAGNPAGILDRDVKDEFGLRHGIYRPQDESLRGLATSGIRYMNLDALRSTEIHVRFRQWYDEASDVARSAPCAASKPANSTLLSGAADGLWMRAIPGLLPSDYAVHTGRLIGSGDLAVLIRSDWPASGAATLVGAPQMAKRVFVPLFMKGYNSQYTVLSISRVDAWRASGDSDDNCDAQHAWLRIRARGESDIKAYRHLWLRPGQSVTVDASERIDDVNHQIPRLPEGFLGSAEIVLHPGSNFLMAVTVAVKFRPERPDLPGPAIGYEGVAVDAMAKDQSGSMAGSRLFAPLIRHMHSVGGNHHYDSGISVVNPMSTSIEVRVTYYGGPASACNGELGAHGLTTNKERGGWSLIPRFGSQVFYQGPRPSKVEAGTEIVFDHGLPDNCFGTAIVEARSAADPSQPARVVAVVQDSEDFAAQASGYNAFPSEMAARRLAAPLVRSMHGDAKRGLLYTTGIQVMNVLADWITVRLHVRDDAGNPVACTIPSLCIVDIPPLSYANFYTNERIVPPGFLGSAIIESSRSNSIVAVVQDRPSGTILHMDAAIYNAIPID